MQFARVNIFGEEVGKPTDRPTSRLGQNNQRQVGVTYGHHGSGQVYNYLGGEGLRTGDIVTPMVTHPKSSKTYRTLARIEYTRNSLGKPAAATAGYLTGKGILMKNIGVTNQASLPGFLSRKAEDPNFTAKQWAQEAKQRYNDNVMRRLNPMGNPIKKETNNER